MRFAVHQRSKGTCQSNSLHMYTYTTASNVISNLPCSFIHMDHTLTTAITFDCDDEYAASLLWTQSAEANDGFVRYPCPRVDRKLNGM